MAVAVGVGLGVGVAVGVGGESTADAPLLGDRAGVPSWPLTPQATARATNARRAQDLFDIRSPMAPLWVALG